jgi:hypothetical protein
MAMARLTDIQDLMFPIEECGVLVDASDGVRPVPGRKAILNARTRDVLGIVGRDYRIVTNEQALDWAMECCRAAFPETKPVEWEVSAADAPGTAGHCYIDLEHRSGAIDFSLVPGDDKPEAYGPFVRVTNSYNGLRALAFDVGFLRKVCRNGLILRESLVRFSFAHSRQDIGSVIRFDVPAERLTAAKASFASFLETLRAQAVANDDFFPLVAAALSIRAPDPTADARTAHQWKALVAHLRDLQGRYTSELGQTAYAVLNVITDFASRPPTSELVRRDRHSLQRLAGAWVAEVSRRCRQRGFRLADMLAPTQPAPQVIGGRIARAA